MIERGNMTDEEYIAALVAENKTSSSYLKKLERENAALKEEKQHLEKEKDKLEIEIECLRKDNHIYIEALILSKHKTFGSSSERTEVEDQQSFFNEVEAECSETSEEPVKKTLRAMCEYSA